MTPSGKSSAKQSIQSLAQASNDFFPLLTKASGTNRLWSLFLTSQILPRYFTLKNSRGRQSQSTVKELSSTFLLYYPQHMASPSQSKMETLKLLCPFQKERWTGDNPLQKGTAVSCQHFQQPGVGGFWLRKGELSKASTVSTTLSNHQIHILNSKKEKRASSSSLRTCPRRDAFCSAHTFLLPAVSHRPTTSCKGNCRVWSILRMAIGPAIDWWFNYWNIVRQLAVHSPSCQPDPQCSSPWQGVCTCLWLPASLGILPTELAPALGTSMLRSDHCIISTYWELFYTHNW